MWAAVREVVPAVERTGLDEGYLGLDEVVDGFPRARVVAAGGAGRRARRDRASRARSASGRCKVVAKVASDRRKPGGLVVVPPGEEASFLAPFAVRVLPGVGPKAAERLAPAGVDTIGKLAALTDDELAALMPGNTGRLLRDRARGIDPRGLDEPVENISMSQEETFARDVDDRERLHDELERMSARLAELLTGSGRSARTVTTKVRYPDFSIRSRSQTLAVGHRRERADRRARLLAPRPRARRPARRAAARRRHGFEPRHGGTAPADGRMSRRHLGRRRPLDRATR